MHACAGLRTLTHEAHGGAARSQANLGLAHDAVAGEAELLARLGLEQPVAAPSPLPPPANVSSSIAEPVHPSPEAVAPTSTITSNTVSTNSAVPSLSSAQLRQLVQEKGISDVRCEFLFLFLVAKIR